MPTLRQRGAAWTLCWSEGGQEIRRSLGRIPVAEAREALRLKRDELKRARLAGIVEFPSGRVPTFRQFAMEYLHWHEREYPASTERIAQLVKQHLIPHFGDTALDRLSKTQAERYKTGRKAKAETVSKELRTLQAVLNRAVYLELITRNPVKGVKPPRGMDSRPPRWYTELELQAIYAHSKPLAGDEAAKGRPVNSPVSDYAPVWRLLANTGLRRAEAQQLKWADVTCTSLRVLSQEGARTKSGKWRQVPLSSGAQAALKALKAMTKGHVLPRMHAGSLSRAFSLALQRAGLDGSLHCLRHTFCAHLVSQGVPLRTVQVLAGHASVTTTERYAHLAPDHLKDSVGRLQL